MAAILPAALEALLGAPEAPAEPLGGGITNHNLRTRYGGRDVVVRLAGKDTGLLGIDRACEREATAAAARRRRRARRSSPTSTTRPRSSPSSSPAA